MTPCPPLLSGTASVDASAVPPAALAELVRRLTLTTRDGAEVCPVEDDGDRVRVPRCAWPVLADVTGCGEPRRELSDGEPLGPCRTPVLRPYQEQAVASMCAAEEGVVVAPCGAGKTVLALAAIGRLGRRSLVLVHTLDLARQWREQCRAVLGLEAGLIGGGTDTRAPVTVALMQALGRWSAPEVEALAKDCGVALVDEAHHVCCRTLAGLLALCPCRRRYGLTATPERADGLTPLLHWLLGPEIHRIAHAELLEAGHLVRARVEWIQTGWTVDLDEVVERVADRKAQEKLEAGASRRSAESARAWWTASGSETPVPGWVMSAVYAALAEDAERNRLIVRLVAPELAAGRTVLVLARLKAHCEALASSLRASGHQAEALTAARTKKQRAALLDAFKAGALRCVVATSLADEGLDVPRLDRIVLASPVRSASAAEQRLGRCLRPCADKAPPALYDLVDDFGPLLGQARARRGVYRRVLGE